jgi:hypothetical protein
MKRRIQTIAPEEGQGFFPRKALGKVPDIRDFRPAGAPAIHRVIEGFRILDALQSDEIVLTRRQAVAAAIPELNRHRNSLRRSQLEDAQRAGAITGTAPFSGNKLRLHAVDVKRRDDLGLVIDLRE